ncbi:MAG TPA: HD-GYP domain-containing protein, partial [Miltoncostaeaceae bacterium]|nr:HD-GYP domain-containing protein [Miltoncostaeaceae bacterium]
AEVALQWARMSGRDRAVAYSFPVAEQVFARQSALLAETPSLRAMRALAWAVDARDPHTHRHSMRVADLAVRIGAALGWPAERLGQLREAGLVHDVGKIAVPDGVLFKPGPLSAEEFAVIRRHPVVGAQIVADVLSPEQARWVRAHHEHWDGGGYPDGLRGDLIPEEARLLAVADAWDVIVSLRAYKEALPPAAALRELRACAGGQFWPVAVEALGRLVESGALADAHAPGDAGAVSAEAAAAAPAAPAPAVPSGL